MNFPYIKVCGVTAAINCYLVSNSIIFVWYSPVILRGCLVCKMSIKESTSKGKLSIGWKIDVSGH